MDFVHRYLNGTQISNLIKRRSVGAEPSHVDRRTNGQTEITQLIFVFAILRTRSKTVTISGTELIRNINLISGTVPEYQGRIFIFLHEHTDTIHKKLFALIKIKNGKDAELSDCVNLAYKKFLWAG